MSLTRAQAEKTLRTISRAWGRKQQGYCFFPWIDREEQRKSGSRRAGYHEGPDPEDPAFKWPEDKAKIIEHMVKHQKHDLYWCPSLFEYPWRREDVAMDEHALWADLDEVDPSGIQDYPPTISWESSPGRYQALWIAASGDFQGASWPGNENQRLTYFLQADRSGWDTTQLLRVPGWVNHKPEYNKNGKYPVGKMLWANGPQYHPGDFTELPTIEAITGNQGLTDALEQEIEAIDRHKVLARVKLKLTRRIRDLLSAREAAGDRSDALWEMERALADAHCSLAEIVAIVRATVWNKYVDRADEMKRLILEASKAIAAKPEVLEAEEEEIERPNPTRFGLLLKNVRRPKYLIDGILTEGAVGFIAGEPKCYKSWIALDMALSVATGAHFLDQFRVVNPGPVLYIQEEDPLPTLKSRTGKIWVGKQTDRLELVPHHDGLRIDWLPPEAESAFDPDINAYVQNGLVISDEAWQFWLDETLAAGMNDEPYRLMIIDTLMMAAGDVEENKSQAMTQQIFKPLKVLSRKYNVAIQVVHHMGKAERPRAGQRMLGAVANHAWSEDSLYLSRAGASDIKMELESKTAPGNSWRVTDLNNTGWSPRVGVWAADKEIASDGQARQRGKRSAKAKTMAPAVEVLMASPGTEMTTKDIMVAMGNTVRSSQVWRQLNRAQDSGDPISSRPGPGNTNLWLYTGS
ncbi:MAG: AAA family ATPase [Actinobacteria bacterium]|nr:AAA family ATPase [Actinomycetota bacterium]